MHYYQFNIGDYAVHTRHLSPIEDITYRRLLDLAYTTELPLIKDIHQLSRLVNMREYQQEIIDILKEFFFEVEDGWVSNRVLKEIEKTGAKSERGKQAVAIRWQNERMKKEYECNTDVSKNDTDVSKNDTTHNTGHITHNPLHITQEITAPVSAKRSLLEINTWLNSLGDSDAIPHDDPIFDYAEKAGIPLDFLALSWKRFVEDMAERKTKKKDWKAHYRNAVRGNWYKIWWLDGDGRYRLTTVGEQAKRAVA